MSKKTTLNSNRPVEERLTAFLKNKAELYSRSTAMSEALFPPLQPNDDPTVGAYGQLVTASSSCRIQSKNSARKLAYSSMAEAVMKLALKSVIPEAVNFIVTGGNNSITLETAKGANFFGRQLSCGSNRLDFPSETKDNPTFVAIVSGTQRNKAMETQNAIVQDQVLFILGAETDRTDLIAPKELEAFSLSIAELSLKPYLLALSYIAEGGIAASSAELAEYLGVGIDISEGKIPALKQKNKPDELLFSESPGRCLAVVSTSHKNEAKKLLRSHSIPCREIGITNSNRVLNIRRGKTSLCSLEIAELMFSHSAPRTHLVLPERVSTSSTVDVASLKQPRYYKRHLKSLLSSAEVQKEFQLLQEQLEDGKLQIMTAQSGGRFWKLDPRQGAILAVASAARRLTVSGVEPRYAVISVPASGHDSDSIRTLRETISGFQFATADLGLQVISRQFISSDEEPLVAVVGESPEDSQVITHLLHNPDDFIMMLGNHRGELGGSAYLKEIHGKEEGLPPVSDLVVEQRIREILITGTKVGLISSASVVSLGGLAVTIAQMILLSPDGIGARIYMSSKIRNDELLFGETQGLYIITVKEENIMELERLCMQIGVTCTAIGRVIDKPIYTFNDSFSVKLPELRDAVSKI
ncbi:MAG: AIR synthase-related protein [Candidatus Marinimicrobia bacterium]|jgi:selenophosphate synthetase-related protein|nr:AIR synthase-related protein [Candidatus Neomarinimicrobiota bacterium]MDP6569229.1 AIR synthase-related protein [Candidatus Neomarinimicrobiota bacterium]